MKIQLKRAYDSVEKSDGYRVLVDRIWPRGIKKEDLAMDEWCKDIAPSSELRTWFNHDPKKFSDFKKRYKNELKNNAAADELIKTIKKHSTTTLLYSAKDTEHNQAVVLQEYLKTLL